MKLRLLVLGILAPVLALNAQSTADYPITVHVQSSNVYQLMNIWFARLQVLVDGRKYVLQEDHQRKNVLRVGDYKAKIAKDDTSHAYEISREYELLLPDGSKRKYFVISETE